ncbi:CDP-alcohol phosphatidyltransferase family protein [Alkalicoccobacillus gibsonii]|uniref:CDP-alcohol phosphatidyltransferase family protein n=1 Tax=Alkalicoccobacillus gibsonii TaxID=79881 RepID=UPI003F7B9680
MSSEKLATLFFDSDKIIELRRQVQPYGAKEDLWSWNVLRRVSIYFTIAFQKLKVTPNVVSWLSVLFVLLSGLFMILATPISFVLAFISYNLGYLFDCVDGELARLTKKTSKLGFFIDMLIRAATLPVFMSFPITLLVMNNQLTLSPWLLALFYFIIICVIMSLLLPLSYDLTHTTSNEIGDPIQKIRNKSFVFEFAGFILGLPGFFCSILLLVFLELVFNIKIIDIYILLFILVLVLKVILRLIITVKTFYK